MRPCTAATVERAEDRGVDRVDDAAQQPVGLAFGQRQEAPQIGGDVALVAKEVEEHEQGDQELDGGADGSRDERRPPRLEILAAARDQVLDGDVLRGPGGQRRQPRSGFERLAPGARLQILAGGASEVARLPDDLLDHERGRRDDHERHRRDREGGRRCRAGDGSADQLVEGIGDDGKGEPPRERRKEGLHEPITQVHAERGRGEQDERLHALSRQHTGSADPRPGHLRTPRAQPRCHRVRRPLPSSFVASARSRRASSVAVAQEERVAVALGYGVADVPGGLDRRGQCRRLVVEEALHGTKVGLDSRTAGASRSVVEQA